MATARMLNGSPKTRNLFKWQDDMEQKESIISKTETTVKERDGFAVARMLTMVKSLPWTASGRNPGITYLGGGVAVSSTKGTASGPWRNIRCDWV
jgi:hypothetical protein